MWFNYCLYSWSLGCYTHEVLDIELLDLRGFSLDFEMWLSTPCGNIFKIKVSVVGTTFK